MKLKRLKREFERLLNGSEEAAEPTSLEILKLGLEEKKAKYTRKLKKGISMEKRDSVEQKLEDVSAMLKEIKQSICKVE